VKNEHGVLAHRRQILFKALATLADAETLPQFEARLQGLKNSADYVGNVALQVYLQREWLSCTEIWVACYRQVCKQAVCTYDDTYCIHRHQHMLGVGVRADCMFAYCRCTMLALIQTTTWRL
jgi:hypothetical protein